MIVLSSEGKTVVPLKNYILLGVILVVSLALIYYLFLWYKTYDDSLLNEPIMDDYLQVINYDELNDYIFENRNAYVYVSVVGNEEIRDFEKNFKSYIVENSLKNKVLYLDLSEQFLNSNEIKLDDSYSLSGSSIPCILVYEDGQIIDTYEIKKNNYNSKNIIKYLTLMGLVEND